MQLQVFSVFFCIFDNHPQPSTYVAIHLLCYQRATPLAEDTSKSTGLLQTQNEGEWPVINADDVHSNVAFTTVAAAGLGKRRKKPTGPNLPLLLSTAMPEKGATPDSAGDTDRGSRRSTLSAKLDEPSKDLPSGRPSACNDLRTFLSNCSRQRPSPF